MNGDRSHLPWVGMVDAPEAETPSTLTLSPGDPAGGPLTSASTSCRATIVRSGLLPIAAPAPWALLLDPGLRGAAHFRVEESCLPSRSPKFPRVLHVTSACPLQPVQPTP